MENGGEKTHEYKGHRVDHLYVCAISWVIVRISCWLGMEMRVSCQQGKILNFNAVIGLMKVTDKAKCKMERNDPHGSKMRRVKCGSQEEEERRKIFKL